MSHVVCLMYYMGIISNLILLVYVYLFQHCYTGDTTKTRLPGVVPVQII